MKLYSTGLPEITLPKSYAVEANCILGPTPFVEAGLADAGVASVDLVRVPGAFELPVACSRLAASYDAVVALGVVIRGGTPHFDYICQAATMGLADVSVRTGVPVGFGVLTCDDEQQALDRAGLQGSSEDKGHEAATAAVSTAMTLRTLRG